ncbi:MAG: PTS sugar transporter subunit IIA [Phycisphaerae bacterium]|nr:PTS sugar transporter subunit IIA [Phycisphaerae bacterium]
MKLRDIVVKKAVLPQLAATKRDDAIRELVNALVEAGKITAELRDTFVKSIIARENRGSTGFGHGVAVPHAKTTSVKQLVVAVGVSKAGVDFNSLDKQPVHSIFLLLSPEDRPEEHLDAMEAIFGNLSRDQFRRFMRQADSVEDIMTLLEEADQKQPTSR